MDALEALYVWAVTLVPVACIVITAWALRRESRMSAALSSAIEGERRTANALRVARTSERLGDSLAAEDRVPDRPRS